MKIIIFLTFITVLFPQELDGDECSTHSDQQHTLSVETCILFVHNEFISLPKIYDFTIYNFILEIFQTKGISLKIYRPPKNFQGLNFTKKNNSWRFK